MKGTISSKKILMFIAGIIVILSLFLIVGARYLSPVFGLIALTEPAYIQEEMVYYIMAAAYNPGDFEVQKKLLTDVTITLDSDNVLVIPEDTSKYQTPSHSFFVLPDGISINRGNIIINQKENSVVIISKIGNEIVVSSGGL